MISAVVAASQNGVIGKDGGLPWHIPSDLKWFKSVTMGKPVIMGRKTWDSLPRKPLPGRPNIVISRNSQFDPEGALAVVDEQSALNAATQGNTEEICVIGGAEIFKLFWPKLGRIYLTLVLDDVKGDTFLPEIKPAEWLETQRQRHPRGDRDSASFDTIIYRRR